MITAKKTDNKLRESILDILVFFANYKIALTDQEILQYLPVKASVVGVKSHLRKLSKRGKIKQLRDGSWRIAKFNYSNRLDSLNKVSISYWVKLIRLIPFVKSVLISGDGLLTREKDNSNDLIVITTPNRIYITRYIMEKFMALLQKAYKGRGPNVKFNYIYTTAGLRFIKEMGSDDLHRLMWFALAKPLYGNKLWENLLKNTEFISKNMPNYIWSKEKSQLVTSISGYLDSLDNTGYRFYLKREAGTAALKDKDCLLRVRPDVYIVSKGNSSRIQKAQLKYIKQRREI